MSYYKKSGKYTEKELHLIEYSYLSIRNDAAKLMILIGIAIAMNKVGEFLCFMIPMMLIRSFLGGIHKQTFLGCLFLTGIWAGTGIGISLFIFPKWMIIYGIVILSLIIPIIYPPQVSERKKKPKENKLQLNKCIGLAAEICFLLVALVLIKNTICKCCICMGVINSNLQVAILNQKITRRR